MSHTFSIYKPATAFALVATAFSCILAAQVPFRGALTIERYSAGVAPPSPTVLADSNSVTPSEQTNTGTLILAAAAVGGVAVSAFQLAVKDKNIIAGDSPSPFGAATPTKTLRDTLQRHLLYRNFHAPDRADITIDRLSRKHRAKLINLLHEDRSAANRLLTQAKLKYPNKTTDWYAEKVIYDLVRDRGGF